MVIKQPLKALRLSIRKSLARFSMQSFFSTKKLSWRVRSLFYEHLRDQIANEISLETSLKYFHARLLRQKKNAYANLIATIIQKLKNGQTFAQSLQGVVPDDELTIILAGELSSKLPFGLNLILEQHARARRLKNTIRQGLTSTVGHLLIACAVLWYLASAVIPQLTSAVPVHQAQGLVSLLYKLSWFVTSPWVYLVPLIFIILLAGFMYSLPRWIGRSRLLAEKYFPFSYYRDLSGYQWLMVFTTLLSSGMADVAILKLQSKNATPYLRERLSLLFHRLHSGGMSLGDALIKPLDANGLSMNFPSPEVNESIVALYGFANFPVRITSIVDVWAKQIEEHTLAITKSLTTFFEFAMMFGMAILILAVQDLANQVGVVAK